MKAILILFVFTAFISKAQTAKSYVLVADTSTNYFELEKNIETLSKTLNQKIDLHGLIYDKTNNLLCLPLNSDDQSYAGAYYPRRYTSDNLSLEYLNYYDHAKSEKTIAIITLITTDKKEAKIELLKLKKHSKKAFLIETDIYMGCMH